MKKYLNLILTIAIFILVGLLGAIIIIPIIKQARPTSVKILVDHSVSSLPVHYATSYNSWAFIDSDTLKKEDIFSRKDGKLIVSVEEERDPGKAIQALLTGEAQFAVLSWPDALLWMSKHPEDTLLCLLSVEFKESRPVDGLFPRKGLKFAKITDLVEMKIGVTSGTEVAMKAVLGSVDIDLAEVNLEKYPEEELLAALESGDVDLILAVEPFFTEAKTHLSEPFAGGALLPNWVGIPYHAAGLFTTSGYLQETPEGIVRMRMALNRTHLEMDLARTEKLGAFLGHIFGVDDPQLTSRYRLPEFHLAPNITTDDIQDFTDRLEIYRVIPNGLDIEELGVVIEQSNLRE